MSRGTPLPAGTDPLSTCYTQFSDLFFDHPKIEALVKSGNKLRFDGGDTDPVRHQRQTADRPNVRVAPYRIQGPFRVACNKVEVRMALQVKVDTGDLRANRGLFPVRWAIMQALNSIRGAGITNCRTITMNADEAEAERDYETTASLKAWSSVCSIEIVLEFDGATFSTM